MYSTKKIEALTMNVGRELSKFVKANGQLWNYSTVKIIRNGYGEFVRLEFTQSNTTMKIIYSGRKTSGMTQGSSTNIWGANYQFVTIYVENGCLYIDTTKSMYMQNNKKLADTEDDVITRHNKQLKIEQIDEQIKNLYAERMKLKIN